ncbi:MAG TPA: DUF262 domain-containing protein [Marinilabiliaceae bacterium]|nr:DUF262 domain-containing protein [Marinilabiliaceae bacterium]
MKNEDSILTKQTEEIKTISEEVKVVSCTLGDLLGSSTTPIALKDGDSLKGQLVIPEYQRPYVWREKQINKLLNDLIEHNAIDIEDKPMYYLGSIILHQDEDQLKIIDGQQRITTALLIKKIAHPNFISGINYTSALSISRIKKNLSYLKSVQNGEIYEYRENLELLNSFDFDKVNVTLIVTNTEDLAYTFFETQNTGGVRLSGSDILKAHHLRALPNPKLVNYQARRWESINSDHVERVVELLTKIRFWDNRKWRKYPFYRDKSGIKSSIIDEYTINTKSNNKDISYYYSSVNNDSGRRMQMHESPYRQIKQPLSNGNNTLDYINEYVSLYEILFGASKDHRVATEFYDFKKRVVHGYNGTIFLKELFEIAMVAYVSRFGFYRMFEAAMWLYRAIYSLRVTSNRNVREDSVFKFVYERQFIDNIIEVFTPDELFTFLKKFRYTFNTAYIDKGKSKRNHIKTLLRYFSDDFIKSADHYKNKPAHFDRDLMRAISNKLKEYPHE